ncbi:MAG: PAT family beta-lactamase induction signal transducer AmpG, partial [Gammaproteobacteria bacterium]
NFLWILVLIILYKLGDAFAGTLTTTFLLRGLEFSLTEVGVVNKGMGLFASIAGGLVGGGLMFKYGLYRCLLWFGILQALTNLGFMILALMAKNYIGMVIVIAMEQIAGGMGTATFVALLITLCDHRFTATQFALFSALSAVGRVFIGPPAGLLVDSLGWTSFFLITFVVALPGLALLIYLRKSIESYHSILNSE